MHNNYVLKYCNNLMTKFMRIEKKNCILTKYCVLTLKEKKNMRAICQPVEILKIFLKFKNY